MIGYIPHAKILQCLLSQLFVLKRLFYIQFFSLIIYTLINDYLNHVLWYP